MIFYKNKNTPLSKEQDSFLPRNLLNDLPTAGRNLAAAGRNLAAAGRNLAETGAMYIKVSTDIVALSWMQELKAKTPSDTRWTSLRYS